MTLDLMTGRDTRTKLEHWSVQGTGITRISIESRRVWSPRPVDATADDLLNKMSLRSLENHEAVDCECSQVSLLTFDMASRPFLAFSLIDG